MLVNKNRLFVIVSLAALAAYGTGWLLLPSLQGPRRAVDVQAAEQIERARRLLDKYNATLAFQSLLIDQLKSEGIEVTPEDLTDDVADQYQQLHEAMWEAYQPNDWPDDSPDPRPARARYGNLPGQIRQGLSTQAKLLGENERLLGDALVAVDRALSITVGDESSRNHAEANRLKGVILYHSGLAKRMWAQLQRRRSDRYRRELIALAIESRASESARTLVADSKIDEQLSRLLATAGELDTAVDEDRERLARLDVKIKKREARLSAVESRRDDARSAMAGIQDEGIDFSDPNGAESYRIRLEGFDGAFREADREARAIKYGTYPNAHIDQSEDYIKGRYVEDGSANQLTVEYGLLHDQNERTVLALVMERQHRALDNVRSAISRLEGMRRSYRQTQSRALEGVTKSASTGSEVHAELNRIESESFAVEESALELLLRSAQSSRQAAGYADQWIRDARERTQALSPKARARSAFDGRLQDGWMGAYIAVQEADARLARAWIYYERYHAHSLSTEILADVAGVLQLNEADVESEQIKAGEAHDAGVEEVKQAMDVLKRAHAKTDRHWTITAQAAGTTYLLALFGHEDYLNDTIEGYRNAVKGREDERFAATFVARLNRLEKR